MSAQPTEPGTELSLLERFPPNKYIPLYPVVHSIGDEVVSPVLIESVSTVRISTHPTSHEVYHDYRYARKDRSNEKKSKYALTAVALQKIAQAAGIKWLPDQCRVVDRARSKDGHIYLRYQAVGAVRQPNGEWQWITGEKEIDTAVFAERREAEMRDKLKNRPRDANYTAEQIPEMVRRDVLQMKENILGHAETKAQNRVIRKLLALPQVFTYDELQKEFAVPRLAFRPDHVDPLLLEQLQTDSRRAEADLYGESPSVADTPSSGGGTPGRESLPDVSSAPEEKKTDDAASAAGKDRGGESPGAEEPAKPAEAEGSPGPSEASPKDARSSGKSASAGGTGEPPSEDPVFADGPHQGDRMSYVAEIEPNYLEAITKESRSKKRRELAQAWLDYTHPELGG